ncbi:unnamed protein product [Dicrocoelium dendriticum]|nr:unnamed protein product [Dicrocoelium dendriticum]
MSYTFECRLTSWDHGLHQLDSAPIPLRSNTMRFFASSDTDSIMFTDSSPQATRRPLWSPTLDAIHPDAS